MLALCGVVTLGACGAYLLYGLRISFRLSKEGKDGRAPVWLAAWRASSYTPEGQRLLSELWKFILAIPLAILFIVFLSAVLCSVFR